MTFRNPAYSRPIQIRRPVSLLILLVGMLPIVAGFLLPPSAARAESTPLLASLDLGRIIRGIAPVPNFPKQFFVFAAPGDVLVVKINQFPSGSVKAQITRRFPLNRALDDVSGMTYQENLDRFFFTTESGVMYRFRREGNGLMEDGLYIYRGDMVNPPQPGNLPLRGISSLPGQDVVLLSDAHTLVVNRFGEVTSQTHIRRQGLVGPSAVDFNFENSRFGFLAKNTSILHMLDGQGQTLFLRRLDDSLTFSDSADFAWDIRRGLVLVTEENNTQEPDLFIFSLVADPKRWRVRNLADVGIGSLREILREANRNLVADVITFNAIEEGYVRSETPLVLSEGFTCIEGDSDGDGRPDYGIQSLGTGQDGLRITSSGNELLNLSIVDAGADGVDVLNGGGNRFYGCWIGLDFDGTTFRPAGESGISILGSQAQGNEIVGCIFAAAEAGISLHHLSTGTVIQGNFLGPDVTGLSTPNTPGRTNSQGIYLDGDTSGHIIGGPRAGEGNVIFNNRFGIVMAATGGAPHDIVIQGNTFGTDFLEQVSFPNQRAIQMTNTTNVLIGGEGVGESNLFIENGILIVGAGSSGISLRQNKIFGSVGPGIVRSGGAGSLVTPPVLDDPGTYRLSGQVLTVTGVGESHATVEVYRSGDPPQPNGLGGAGMFLGAALADGRGLFSLDVPSSLGVGAVLTAIQTNSGNNTSSFATNVVVPDVPHVSARAGTVNAESGTLQDVLFLNGETGNGERAIALAMGQPVGLVLDAPRSRPAGARFVIYVWMGVPRPETVCPLPFGTARMVRGAPFHQNSEPTRLIMNNLGLSSFYGESNRDSSPAPTVLFSRPGGFRVQGSFTIQGLIEDDPAPGGLSVTNALLVFIQ